MSERGNKDIHDDRPAWKRNGVAIFIPSAIVAAVASMIWLNYIDGGRLNISDHDDVEKLREVARPDPYTGSEHQQFSKTVDEKFNAQSLTSGYLQREIDRIEITLQAQAEARDLRLAEMSARITAEISDLEFQKAVLDKMQHILEQLTAAGAKRE